MQDETSGIGATRSQFPGRSVPGQAIGPYALMELIGEGGMGEVWVAEQKEPVRRRVAIKLIKSGMDTQEVVARFESERQALALMDHPNIAKVFDAGSTPDGRPFFVMEYVAGLPITTYCDKHKLTTQQRMEVFIHVCEGVQHAHQKAIIHRDLKPSNILVSEVDGKPMPRIIDFGVAKATSQRLTDQTMYTHVGAILGTLEYMSPEQADSAGQDIDTRTDVYSLGVVLYELLVGALPLDFRKMAFDQAMKILREEDAPKPSTKLRTLGDKSVITAQNRGVEIPALTRQLQGDPDAIVMKAVEKDRARRYATPLEFSADLERYLRNEPVRARPASAAYRARKYVQRHTALVAATATIFVVLVAAVIVSTWEATRARMAERRANSEAAVAKATNDFLQNDLLAQASSNKQAGLTTKPDPDLKVRTALDRAAQHIEGKFAKQPEVEAAVRNTIGETYRDLGLYSEARTQLEQALQLENRTLGPDNPRTLRTFQLLGKIASDQGDNPKAEALLTEALQHDQKTLGTEDRETLAAARTLATVYWAEAKYAQAEALDLQTLDASRRVLGPEHPDTVALMNNLALVYGDEGKTAETESLRSQTLEIMRRVQGPEHPDTLMAMNNLANVYFAEGKYEQALALRIQALDLYRRLLGPEHPDTLRAMTNLASSYNMAGKSSQAEALDLETLALRRRVLGPEHPSTLNTMQGLGDVYVTESQYAKAESLYKQLLEIRRRVLGPEHPSTVYTMQSLADLYLRTHKYEQAESLYKQTLEIRQRVLGPDHPDTLSTMSSLIDVYTTQRQFEQAGKLAGELLKKRQRVLGPDNPDTLVTGAQLAVNLAYQKQLAKAQDVLHEMIERASQAKDQSGMSSAWYEIACAEAVMGKSDLAIDYLKKAIDISPMPADFMSTDQDLKSLHNDPRFAEIIAMSKQRAAAINSNQ